MKWSTQLLGQLSVTVRSRMLHRGDVGPWGGIGGALRNPFLQQFGLGGFNVLAVLRRRHALLGVGAEDARDHLALGWIAGSEGITRAVLGVEPQLRLALVGIRAVAGETIL